jgi:hypothetical protein
VHEQLELLEQQVSFLALETPLLALKFVLLALETPSLAVKFTLLHVKFVLLALETPSLAVEFVSLRAGPSLHEHPMAPLSNGLTGPLVECVPQCVNPAWVAREIRLQRAMTGPQGAAFV